MKKLIAMVLTLVMGISILAGCGSGDSSNESETTGDSDVVTLKWIQVGNGMPDNYDAWLEQINPYLEEKIGVNIEMEIVPWGDWDNRRSVIVNSGEYFDILFTDQTRYNAEVATGAFLDISEMVKEEASELYEMIPEDYWTASSINGSLYAIPTYKDSAATNYFIWDKEIADKYNLDYANINNFNDLYTAMKTIKDGEGGSPYYMSKNGADFLATTYYDQLGAGLLPIAIRYDDETKTVINPMTDEWILEQMDVVYKMYQEGIINGDAAQSDDSLKYHMFFTAQGWSGAAETTWGPNYGIDDCVSVPYDENTVVSNTTVRGSMNAIYSGSKYPEKALQLLSLVNTDSKVRDLFYYGAEGENFEYDSDGKVERLNNEWYMAGYTQGTFFNVTQQASEEFNQWDEVKELNENAAASVMLGFDMDTSSIETELANCRAVYEKYKYEFWTGTREPREFAETIQKELDSAGWETIRAEAQKQVDAAK